MYEALNQVCPYLFQREGKRILSLRTVFVNTRKRLGLPELLFHDQRRTAVTNMIREGVPEHEAMAVSGHLDRSMLQRYSIAKEQDVKRVAQRMTERFLRQRKDGTRQDPEKLWHKLWHGDSTASRAEDASNSAKLKN